MLVFGIVKSENIGVIEGKDKHTFSDLGYVRLLYCECRHIEEVTMSSIGVNKGTLKQMSIIVLRTRRAVSFPPFI
jgi:hypothetical protein